MPSLKTIMNFPFATMLGTSETHPCNATWHFLCRPGCCHDKQTVTTAIHRGCHDSRGYHRSKRTSVRPRLYGGSIELYIVCHFLLLPHYRGSCCAAKHIKNATWPEGCGQRNEKTRKRENQKTEKTEKTRKREIENQKTGTLLLAVFGFSSFSPFSRFRVFAVFAFSRFPRFRGFLVFAVFAVFALSPFSRPQVDSSRFRVFGFSRFRVHRCFHMFSPGVFVLQNGLLRYILYTCPKLW